MSTAQNLGLWWRERKMWLEKPSSRFTGVTNVLAHVLDTVFVFYSSLTYSHMLYILFLYKLYFILKQVAWQ